MIMNCVQDEQLWDGREFVKSEIKADPDLDR
jgi:hypothetical protein